MKHCYCLCVIGLVIGLSSNGLYAQRNLAGAAELAQKLDSISTVGSVMMIAAHPDDENTALLAYFARGRHLRTAYLSLTRGEGGQNLIGSEQGDLLGLIRTQELLAARKIDGGEQYFTRAIDFGFSKSAEETLTKWPTEKILADIVWNIRRFRPDVIVLRFSGTPRDGHGQHQVSAILGRQAFSMAGDPANYPEQLKFVEPWTAKRLLFNTFAFTAEQEKEEAKRTDRMVIDTGEYAPELGYSFGEIAGMSRSQHRSQAMGSPERKGSQKNYLVHLLGTSAKNDPFDEINQTWSRFRGGDAIGALLTEAKRTYDPKAADKIVPLLLKARPLLAKIDDPLARWKLKELDDLIALASGLWVDAATDKWNAPSGTAVKFNVTAINRSRVQATLVGIKFTGMENGPSLEVAPAVLSFNQPSIYTTTWKVPAGQGYTQPFWLASPKDGSLYTWPGLELGGLADNPAALRAQFSVKIGDQIIELTRPVENRYVDRVLGEMARPFVVTPPVALDLAEHALVFPDTKPRRVEVLVKANTAAKGEVKLEAPQGWTITPATQAFEVKTVGEERSVSFEVMPPAAESRGRLRASATIGEQTIGVGMNVIQYPHIPPQTTMPAAEVDVIRVDIKTLARRVGYIVGAGDEIPAALKQMGCEVTLLSSDDIARGDLSKFDAIVAGVRAFNTRADIRSNYERLYDYVRAGGTFIVQYNVQEGGRIFGGDAEILANMGPYPIKIGRNDRVTVEDAPVTFLKPAHPLLNTPNKITSKDFDGWIQERGLYFATEWDPKYETIWTTNDPGEQPLAGGTLYTRLGKGAYVFSAYSWFRELPAGVPGAYRLFANMLSAGKAQ